ncbi:MAG: hypothetical protein CMA72_09490 [Euryarchaeota archaeon]|nr:hypothetical protein [Euryarchaeota archaeon]
MSQKDFRDLTSLFEPAVSRGSTTKKVESVQNVTLKSIGEGVSFPTESFRLDPPGSPLKNTQQIPLDYSKFENHTFFNSAESNVNVAFSRIINNYPFDGTADDIQAFLDGLTGFEKYVFDQFPKFKNFARFIASDSTTVTVDDFAGTSLPTLSRDKTGQSILDPGSNSISFEMQYFSPSETTSPSVLFQKLSGSSGFSVVASGSAGSTNERLQVYFSSASVGLSASLDIPKGQFNHIVAQFNRLPGNQRLEIYVDSLLSATSSAVSEFGNIDFAVSPLTIGSGSVHASPGFVTFTPTATLSGAIDELRIFHATRSIGNQKNFATQNIFPSSDLKLYYKFNEVTGTHGGNTIVLDASGNSLHGSYANSAIAAASRGTAGQLPGLVNPMTLEKLEDSPVLFPGFSTTVSLNSDLLSSASQYDANNPNIITKLVPQHYLLEAAQAEGFANEDADTGDPLIQAQGAPGGAKLPSSQIIATLLFMYAKFFDELKIYIDHMSKLNSVGYDSEDTIADTFLIDRAKQLGFDLPSQFTAANFAQFLLAKNIDVTSKISSTNLVDAQNKLWRRFLVSLPEIIRSKGTRSAVRGIFNTLGIEEGKIFKTIEFGGRNVDKIETARIEKTIDLKFVDFSGSFAGTTAVDGSGFATDKPLLKSSFLSSSRTEPGAPLPGGTLTSAGTNYSPDGLFTSSSFSVEGIYKFDTPLTGTHFLSQSLFRIATTGSFVGVTVPVIANVVAIRPDVKLGVTGTIMAFTADSVISDSAATLILTGVNIFDGMPHHVSFGRKKLPGTISPEKVEYFVSVRDTGMYSEPVTARSLAKDIIVGNVTGYSFTGSLNKSGSYLIVGSQSLDSTSVTQTLVSTDYDGTAAKATEFSGKLAELRFWSKALSEEELAAHALNPGSLGVINPHINFDFGKTVSGSFEKLRLAATMQQPVTTSDASGNISFFDYAQGVVTADGTGFEASKRVIEKSRQRTVRFSSNFDVNSTDEKIEVQSLNNAAIADLIGATSINDIDYLRPTEIEIDNRMLVEVSVAQALDEDIMNIFASFEELEKALGAGEKLFADDYSDLRHLREIYFNRLNDKINLGTFFDFFRFFDKTIETLLRIVLPQNSNFLGVHFVVEPHVLERGKIKYYGEDIYLSPKDKIFSDVQNLENVEGGIE